MTKNIFSLALLFLICSAFISAPNKTVHDFKVQDIFGNDVSLSKYEGKTLLIVNVASKCGLTPQYEDLQKIYDKYKDYGLTVMGFPANNFMGQEPGSNDEINRFCNQKFGVTFPMFSKISVKGNDIHPLYQYLTNKSENGVIDAPVKWNFQKFLVDTEGQVVTSFAPTKKVFDKDVEKKIQSELLKMEKGNALKAFLKEEAVKAKAQTAANKKGKKKK